MAIAILLTDEQAAQVEAILMDGITPPYTFLLGRVERVQYDGNNVETCGKRWRIVCIIVPDSALDGIRKAIEKPPKRKKK